MKNNLIRLNKYISNSGLCTRREADNYILNGRVSVDGKTITILGSKILTNSKVRVDGKLIVNKQFKYLLLNKPSDFDLNKNNNKNIFNLVKSSKVEELDTDEVINNDFLGLVVLSNDKSFNHEFVKSLYQKKQLFHIKLDKELCSENKEQIRKTNSKKIKISSIDYVSSSSNNEVGIELTTDSVSNIYKIFEKLDYKIVSLDRVLLANFSKKDLGRGKWRFIEKIELSNFSSF
jgi:23S rRNA pseudouridine2605 synthase